MAKPVVAIVGRPNVGKSTLFNKIAGTRISIVDDTPGVTRDRVFADAEWLGRDFTLIDTGGIEPKADDEILSQMRAQAQLAIEMAHVVIFIVNVRDGLTAADKDVAALLIKSGKPIVLAVNKVDNTGDPPMDFYEFYNLGLGDPVAISSTHGLGVGDLLDECAKHFPSAEEGDEEENIIKVAVVGKPNAGKSSLINRILGEERVIVTNIAGTTRDAIDTHYERNGQKYTFIDTAGIRRKSKVDEQIERYSVIRAFAAVERSDVCIIMIDGAEGITEQDSKIAGFVHESGKAAIVVVNKWDIVEKETNTMKNYKLDILDTLAFMQYAPIQFISAKTGARVDKLFDMINAAAEQNARRITTGMLNDVIGEATAKVQPPSDKGKRLRIYYATQATAKPPTFVIFVNKAELFHFSYQRYLENQLRAAFGFEGTPIRFIIRERGDKK